MTSPSPFLAQRYVFAGMAICITMMMALLWMPALLGALAQGYGLDARALSYLAFSELFGFLLGTLFTSTRGVDALKRWVWIGCATLIGVNLALMLSAPAIPFIALRPIAGLASGIGFGYGLKLCTASATPTRSFGIFTGLMSLMMIAGFQVIASLIELRSGSNVGADMDGVRLVVKTVFAIYAIGGCTAAVILLLNQPPVAEKMTSHAAARGTLEASVIIVLLGIVLSFIGQGGVWAFLQTLGISHGFPVKGVANAMSAFAFMGIVGSFSAAALPHKVSRWVAIGIALLALWIGLYALYAPASLAWYIGGCAIGGFYWNFALSLMLGLLARVDRSGKGSVFGGTMSSTGSALGPIFAGLLIRGDNYDAVGWMAAALCTAGLICVWLVESRSAAAAPVAQPG